MKNAFSRAIEFRHACRHFRDDLLLTDEELDFVLEAGRLSPSSMGLEPWRFVVVRSQSLKTDLEDASGGQTHVGRNGALIVLLAKVSELDPGSDYVRRMLQREAGGDPDRLLRMYERIAARTDRVSWSVAQCHIAAANIMTAAAYIGIDTCPVGHFDAATVASAMAVDRAHLEPALLLPLGHRVHQPGRKQRLPLSDLVDYR